MESDSAVVLDVLLEGRTVTQTMRRLIDQGTPVILWTKDVAAVLDVSEREVLSARTDDPPLAPFKQLGRANLWSLPDVADWLDASKHHLQSV